MKPSSCKSSSTLGGIPTYYLLNTYWIPIDKVWQGTVVTHDGLDTLFSKCWRNFSSSFSSTGNSENTTLRLFNCFTSVSLVTMFTNELDKLTVLSKTYIGVKTSDMWRSLVAHEFWLRISSVLLITYSKKLFTSESSSRPNSLPFPPPS